jgi:hypothetical protein
MTHATMPDLSLDATAKADDWSGPGLTYRVEAQFGLHVTQAQLHADLRAAPDASPHITRPLSSATTDVRPRDARP